MAGDWIKMRTDLYRDPKVCAIADKLMHQHGELAAYVSQNCQRDMTITRNVMRNVTVGALVSVWGVMRLRGKRTNDDLCVKGAALWVIDDVSEIPGFGAAMSSVGWVEADEDGVVFPGFFGEYNVDPNEDAAAKNAERQRRFREKQKLQSNVTESVTETLKSNAREEKRREEKKNTNTGESASRQQAIACPPDVPEQVWKDWKQLRKAKRAPVTETVIRGAQSEADKAGMTLEAFLAIWCRRGSQGLEAAWLKPEERAFAETNYARSMREKYEQVAPAIAAKPPGYTAKPVIFDFEAIPNDAVTPLLG